MGTILFQAQASSLGNGVQEVSFYYDECDNDSKLLASAYSDPVITIFSRAQFLAGITLEVPDSALSVHVKTINKECRDCDLSPKGIVPLLTPTPTPSVTPTPSATPTPTIEVAAILLANGSCPGGEEPTGSFDGRMFVTASWSGFTTNGSGKLVLNNGISFNGVDTPTINPALDPSVIVVSESVDFPISAQSLTPGSTYLVHVDSLVNLIDNPGDKIKTTVDLSANASFTSCEL